MAVLVDAITKQCLRVNFLVPERLEWILVYGRHVENVIAYIIRIMYLVYTVYCNSFIFLFITFLWDTL